MIAADFYCILLFFPVRTKSIPTFVKNYHGLQCSVCTHNIITVVYFYSQDVTFHPGDSKNPYHHERCIIRELCLRKYFSHSSSSGAINSRDAANPMKGRPMSVTRRDLRPIVGALGKARGKQVSCLLLIRRNAAAKY